MSVLETAPDPLFCIKTEAEALKTLKTETSYAYRILGIFCVIAAVLIALFLYCIVKIISVLSYFYKRRKAQEKQKKDAVSKSGGIATIVNADNDNEEYASKQLKPGEYAEARDEYYQFQETIDKSLGAFKAYNEKLKDYFATSRDKPPPDQYDRRVFDDANDDW